MAIKDDDIWHANSSKTLANMFEFNRQQPDSLTTEGVIEHFKKESPRDRLGYIKSAQLVNSGFDSRCCVEA